MMCKSILLFFLLTCTKGLYSQTAIEYFTAAKTSLEAGDTEHSLQYLQGAQDLLGGSNAKIESLRMQTYYAKNDLLNAGIAFRAYDKYLSNVYKSGEPYLNLKAQYEQILISIEKEYADEEKRIKDEIESDFNSAKNQRQTTEAALVQQFEKAEIVNAERKLIFDKTIHPDEYMFDAVYKNDVEDLQFLIENGGDVNLISTKGNPLIQYALILEHNESFSELLNANSDLSLENSEGLTTVQYCTQNLDYKHLEEIFAFNYYMVNVKSSMGETALFTAVKADKKEMISFLLLYPADVNIRNKDGYTILHKAVDMNNGELCQFLVQRAACEKTIRNSDNQTAADMASNRNYTACYSAIVSSNSLINSSSYRSYHQEQYELNADKILYSRFIREDKKRIAGKVIGGIVSAAVGIAGSLLIWKKVPSESEYQFLVLTPVAAFGTLAYIAFEDALDIQRKSVNRYYQKIAEANERLKEIDY
jgi:ankyrin repeat protein